MRAAYLMLLLLVSPSCVAGQVVLGAPVEGEPGAPIEEPTVRVGIIVDSATATLSSTTGLEIMHDMSGRPLREVPAATPVVFRMNDRGFVAYEIGGATTSSTNLVLWVRPTGGGVLLIGGRTYRGGAEIKAASSTTLTAINIIDMEPYLLGVVPREIGAIGDTLIEAAKAQAVAARTYAFAYLGRRASLGFDVFATVQDQVYGGMADEHPTITRAVQETAGEIITFGGEPIEAYYHSTCAGRTVAIQDAWPTEAPRSYLVSVIDVDPVTGQAYDTRSSRFRWTVRWEADSLEKILTRTLADTLRAKGRAIGDITDVRVGGLTPTGRVRELRITTTTGEIVLSGREIDMRRILVTPQNLPLNSTNFQVEMERDASGAVTAVVATGGGWGHGIGMCQVGAMGRARAGQDYRTILGTYFPTTVIEKLY